MKKFSFQFKILSLCLFLCFVSILISLISYNGLRDVNQANDIVIEDVVPRVELVNSMALVYRKIRISVRTLGLKGLNSFQRDEAIKETINAISKYKEHSTQMMLHPMLDVEKKLVADLNLKWTNFEKIGVRAIELAKKNDEQSDKDLTRIFLVDCPEAAGAYMEVMSRLLDFYTKNLMTTKENSKFITSKTDKLILLVSIVGVLIGLGIAIFFSHRMSKSIGLISDSLKESASKFNNGAKLIAKSSEDLTASSSTQISSLQQTSAAIEEISSMVELTASNSQNSSAIAQSSLVFAEKGKTIVAKMIESMDLINNSNDQIVNKISDNNKQMEDIVKLIEEINDKTKIINEIVFQTKLLSFNASVEAARAGEAGKGFAVVAEEVGKLAQMSGAAAFEIGEMLENSTKKVELIAKTTEDEMMVLIDSAKKTVAMGSATSKECQNILEEIVTSITSVTASVKEISTASSEQSKGLFEVKDAVKELDETTLLNSNGAKSSLSLSESLELQSDELSSLIIELGEIMYGNKAS